MADRPIKRTDSDDPPMLEEIGPVASIRPASDDDRIARVEIVANAALQQVTALRGDFDGMRSGVEIHVKATVKAELDPIRVSLARQDGTLAQILELAEAQHARHHRMKIETLDEEIKVEDLRGKKVANQHAIEIDPRIDGERRHTLAVIGTIVTVVSLIATLVAMAINSQRGQTVTPPAVPTASHH